VRSIGLDVHVEFCEVAISDHRVAVVAAARKLACLFWCLLTRSEDYAYQHPSLTAKKLRLLEIRAGAKTLEGTPTGTGATRARMRTAERELAETGRGRLPADRRRLAANAGEKEGRRRDTGARIQWPVERAGSAAGSRP
jgi:hypothetical protein